MTILHGVIGLSHGDGTTQILPSREGTVVFTRVHRSVVGETVRMPESVAVEYSGGVLPETQLAAGAWRVEVAPCDARADDWMIDVPESGLVALASLVPVAEVDGITYTRGESVTGARWEDDGLILTVGSTDLPAVPIPIPDAPAGGLVEVATDGDGTYTLTRSGALLPVDTDGDGTYTIGA